MNEIRRTYLSCLQVALELVERSEVEQRWDEPSALYGWSVSGLTGHLTRAFTTVIDYLEAVHDAMLPVLRGLLRVGGRFGRLEL